MQFRLAILAALLSQVWALVVPQAGGRTISRSWTMSTGKMPAWLRSTIVSIGVAAGTLGAPTLDPAGTIARAADTLSLIHI